MRGDPRYFAAWRTQWHGDEQRREREELKRRLRLEKAACGRIDDTGPLVRLTGAWIRGNRRLAMQIARAVDIELDWYGERLSHEREDRWQ